MNAYVKKDDCIGCGMCVDVCPEVFEIGSDGYSEAVGNADDHPDKTYEAAEICPVNAIEIQR